MELELGVLQRLALFSGLSIAELSQVQKALHRKIFAAGIPLLWAEQWGDVMYIVQHGTVKVHIEQADGKDVILAILGAGELVGELSILDRQGRAASVVTLEQSTLLWINRPEFEEFLTTMPQLTLSRPDSSRKVAAGERTNSVVGDTRCLWPRCLDLAGLRGRVW